MSIVREREWHRRDILDWIHMFRALLADLRSAEREIKRLRKTFKEPAMTHDDLKRRAEAAIKRITSGAGTMRVPADRTDPDIVISDLLAALEKAEALRLACAELLEIHSKFVSFKEYRKREPGVLERIKEALDGPG